MKRGAGPSERDWDRLLGIRTGGLEEMNGGRYMPYEPTPYPVLARLADSGWLGSGDHLLDYGSGKGRAAIFLADRTGCRAAGVERSERLFSLAEANRAALRDGSRVRFFRCGAENYAPREEDAFFFFNPFSAAVLGTVLRRLRSEWERRPREMKLMFYYPSGEYLALLESEDWLAPNGEIDCRDLAGEDDPRERILLFRAEGSPGTE